MHPTDPDPKSQIDQVKSIYTEDEQEYIALIHLDDSAEIWEPAGDRSLQAPLLTGESIV